MLDEKDEIICEQQGQILDMLCKLEDLESRLEYLAVLKAERRELFEWVKALS